MEITARVRQSSHPNQGAEQAELARHIVLDTPLVGRLRREAGDALCRPACEFFELERGDVGGEATCRKCLERAARYDVRVITTAAAHPAETVEAELAATVEAVEQAERAAGTWRGGWIASTPPLTSDALFDMGEGDQGVLFD
ncbi:hypothetical protein [Streptomyces nigrescens]|uniref:hypothetical protein n=1 Tax=Streptomyces nigrescens TaxID=1920 RepID=UPI002257C90F|nr:hypothetical protein [Streptomyces libani]MCX5445990.1 hypothetical protein [Streptomyces libani]